MARPKGRANTTTHLCPHSPYGAQLARPERHADGDEAVERDEHCDPDGGQLGDVDEGPEVLHEVGVERVLGVPVVERERREDLSEPGRQQERVVRHSHHLRRNQIKFYSKRKYLASHTLV